MPLRATLALICAATPTIALAQLPPAKAIRELSTDRPDKTESPFTVAAGRIQVELDVASFVGDEEQGAVSETFTIAPVSLKFGIARNTDLQLIFGGHILRTERIAATPVPLRTQGVGDVTVRLKHNLWGNDGGPTALAFLPFLTLPTGSNGLGVEAVEFGLIVPLAMSVAPGVGVGLMTEIDFVRSDRSRLPAELHQFRHRRVRPDKSAGSLHRAVHRTWHGTRFALDCDRRHRLDLRRGR